MMVELYQCCQNGGKEREKELHVVHWLQYCVGVAIGTLSNAIISSIQNKYIPSSVAAVTVPFDPITYPTWSRLSVSDKEVVRNRLRNENIQVRKHFAQMFKSIQNSFHGVDHIEVLNYLAVEPDTEHIDWANKLKKLTTSLVSSMLCFKQEDATGLIIIFWMYLFRSLVVISVQDEDG